MRGLLMLAALSQALLTDCTATPASYTCPQEQDTNATNEALHFINEHHHHGYKFKLVNVDSRTAQEVDPCEVVMALTLEETKCHIVNPKPFDECELRPIGQMKVTAKCNVTICGGKFKPGIKEYTCDTEPASVAELVRICPDCPILLPLHDPKGLESVTVALEKFNNESNHKSHFKLLEVGRITSQFNMMFGQSYFAEFAIVETECSDKNKTEDKTACQPLCDQEAHHGFCISSRLGNDDLTVDCEVYEAQNTTHHHHAPFLRRHCGHRKGHWYHSRHHHPDHAGSGHGKRPDHAGSGHDKHPGHDKRPGHDKHPGHDKRPDHAGSGHDKRPGHAGSGHDKRPDHAGSGHDKRPDHAGSGHDKRPGHAGSGHDKHHHEEGHSHCFVRSDHPHHRGPKHHGDHHEHKKDPTKPTRPPQQHLPHSEPTPELPGSSEQIEFPFPQCHGVVKIPPSIHPICPFPHAFMRRGQKS
ncbi:alpha-2-HS-glycoprotein 1 [Brachyhypopomus gauderio]|uniref:alpha-2-HS-glycoprotein 1 n=1 Tax=Brachyhypopomus gauderio TaxID=698409 RepID=UPI0040431DB9